MGSSLDTLQPTVMPDVSADDVIMIPSSASSPTASTYPQEIKQEPKESLFSNTVNFPLASSSSSSTTPEIRNPISAPHYAYLEDMKAVVLTFQKRVMPLYQLAVAVSEAVGYKGRTDAFVNMPSTKVDDLSPPDKQIIGTSSLRQVVGNILTTLGLGDKMGDDLVLCLLHLAYERDPNSALKDQLQSLIYQASTTTATTNTTERLLERLVLSAQFIAICNRHMSMLQMTFLAVWPNIYTLAVTSQATALLARFISISRQLESPSYKTVAVTKNLLDEQSATGTYLARLSRGELMIPPTSSSSSSYTPGQAAQVNNPGQFKGQALETWRQIYDEVNSTRANQYLPFIVDFTFNRTPMQAVRDM